jgi:hypothetical protein
VEVRVRTVWRVAIIGFLVAVIFLTMGVVSRVSYGWAGPIEGIQSQRVRRTAVVDRQTSGQAPKLTVRVYNYARLNPASLGSAERVAEAIFAAAGVETEWVDCPLSEAEYQARPACQTRATSTDIDLKILPRHMAEKLRMREDLLGFVRPCSDGDPACEVTIFNHVVDELAAYGYRADAILGHAIAHEIAHVLVGGAHSETGIMRAEWSRRELQKMSWGILLGFSGEQSEALVAAAERREMARDGLVEEASAGRVDLGRGAK